jgi:SPP1 gp7 family putative phage head morphogenesis protein
MPTRNLQIQAAVSEQLKKRGRLRRGRKMLPPRTLEREYLAAILRIMREAREAVRAILIPELPNIEAQAIQDSIRVDGYGESVQAAVNATRRVFWDEMTDDNLERIAERSGQAISTYQAQQLNLYAESVIDIDVTALFPDATAALEGFAKDNVSLIKSIPERYFAEIEQTALRNFRAGRRASDWMGELQKRYQVSRSRAALIARDQTNKLAGELNKRRQTSLGLTHYFWRDSDDERVRPTHQEFNGNKYAWNGEPRPPEGHPGEPINCRCWADPDFESLAD